jgi:hypothetical protein
MDSLRGYAQGALSFLNADGLVPQLVLTIVIVLVIHTIIMLIESLVQGIRQYSRLTTTLVDNTIQQQEIITQDPITNSSRYVYPSKNEVNGIEFSYSLHLYVDPETYKDKSPSKVRHVLHKGAPTNSNNTLELMSPGIFLREDENTLRIYMNIVADSANSNQDNYVEIPNIPIGKWFHLVIVQRGQNMDTYINGNLAVRRQFNNVPLINYGHVYVLLDNRTKLSDTMGVNGAMKGMISRVKYYAYGLSYAQIDSLYREGPSSKIESKSYDQTPPYFHDSWWVTRFNPASSHYGV